MIGKKKKQGLTWEYIKEHHPEILEELRTLRNWDTVRSTIPESETIGDYSLLSLEAISALIMELRVEKELLSERLDVLSKKLEDLNTTYRSSSYTIEKKIKELEDSLSELEKRLLFLDSVETLLPRLGDIEDRVEKLPSEIMAQIEDLYGKKIDEYINEYMETRLREFEKKLKEDVFGISVNLAETLRALQEKYEKLVAENIELKGAKIENEKLKKELMEKEKELEELRRQVKSLQEVSKKVDILSQRVAQYRGKLEEIKEIENELKSIAGVEDVKLAIQFIKKQLSQKAKLEKTLKEIKLVIKDLESLKEENERLRKENEKLKDALKMLLQEKLEGEESFLLEETKSE